MIRGNLAVSVCVYLFFNERCQLLISLDGDQCSNHSLVLKNSHNEMVIKFSVHCLIAFIPQVRSPLFHFIFKLIDFY